MPFTLVNIAMSLNIIKKLKDIIFKKLYLNFLLSDFFFTREANWNA